MITVNLRHDNPETQSKFRYMNYCVENFSKYTMIKDFLDYVGKQVEHNNPESVARLCEELEEKGIGYTFTPAGGRGRTVNESDRVTED